MGPKTRSASKATSSSQEKSADGPAGTESAKEPAVAPSDKAEVPEPGKPFILPDKSTIRYFENAIRNSIGHLFSSQMDLELDSIRLVGRRHKISISGNFGIFCDRIARKLERCIQIMHNSVKKRGNDLGLIKLALIDCMIAPSTLDVFRGSLRFVRDLELSNNAIGSRGATLLADSFQQGGCKLVTLKLVNTSIVDISVSRHRVHGVVNLDGFRRLMFSLAVNDTLRTLDLRSNYLGGTISSGAPGIRTYGHDYGYQTPEEYGFDTMKILVYYLAVNRTVRHLNILCNGFADDALLANSIINTSRSHPSCLSLCGSDSHKLSQRTLSRLRMSRLTHLSIPNLIASEIIECSFPSSVSYAGAGLTPFEGRLLGSERCFFGDVEVLDLSNNIGFCDGIMHLCEALPKAGSAFSLRELELRKIGISPVTLASLVKLVSAFPIQKLDVSDNRTIGDVGVSVLAVGLRNNRHLSTLKLRDVGLTTVGVNSLAELLLQNAIISTLDIGQNAITCEGIVVLSLPLHTNKTLTSLGLSDCKILPPGTTLMTEVMKTSKLRSLDMSVNAMCGSRADNLFDPAPILQLADSIHDSNRTLTYLNLSRSDIGARSTRRLMFALSVNPHLRTLVIDSCNISEEGAVHVGEGLPLLLGLETLQISSCGVGPIGCERIFLGLIHNTSVTSLDVSGNQLTGYLFGENNNQIEYDLNAVRAISAALASNTTLRYLNLSSNRLFGLSMDRHVPSEGDLWTAAISAIADGVEQNGKAGGNLQVLNLLENRLSSKQEQNCQVCVSTYLALVEQLDLVANKRNAKIMTHFMEVPQCGKCKGYAEVTELLEAAATHPRLTSLLGITPTTTHVNLNSKRCCDQYMRLLEAELRKSHTIESCDIENNTLSPRGLDLLLGGVEESLALCSMRISTEEIIVGKVTQEPHMTMAKIASAVKQSFHYRIMLAIFIHGFSHLGAASCRKILEFAIGPGPLIKRFLRHRLVWTEWDPKRLDRASEKSQHGGVESQNLTESSESTSTSTSRKRRKLEGSQGPRGIKAKRKLTYPQID